MNYSEIPGSQIYSAGGSHAWFGFSISISDDGQWLYVGNPYYDGLSTNSGAVRQFQWNGSGWTETNQIIPAGTPANTNIGGTNSISGDNKVLFCSGGGYAGTTSHSNKIYVFDINGVTVTERAGVVPLNTTLVSDNPRSLSTNRDGSVLIVGDPGNNSVYYLKYINGRWVEFPEIKSNDQPNDGAFGYSVALSDDGLTMVICDPTNANGGRTYVFELESGSWNQTHLITGEPIDTQFARGSAISNNIISIGVTDNGSSISEIRHYKLINSEWSLIATTPSPNGGIEGFADGLAMVGDRMVVGEWHFDSFDRGKVYTFELDSPVSPKSISYTINNNIDVDQFKLNIYDVDSQRLIDTEVITTSGTKVFQDSTPVKVEIEPDYGESWKPNHVYSIGDRTYSDTHHFRCITSGTSGGTTPLWITVNSGTTTDNTVEWLTIDNIEQPIIRNMVIPL